MPSIVSILTTVDEILAGVALILFLGLVAVWIRRSCPSPLRMAPDRSNDLREDILAVVILIYMVSFAVFVGIVKLITGPEENEVLRLIAGTGTQVVGIATCLVVADRFFGGGIRRFLLGSGSLMTSLLPTSTIVLVVLSLGLCPLVASGTMELILLVSPEYEFATHPTIDALRDHSLPILVLGGFWIGAIVLAPVAEELFFRGLIQTFLGSHLPRRWMAILFSSVAFGLVHSSQVQAIGALTLLGVILGLAYERSGSLIPPMIIHAVFNLRTLIWDALSNGIA